MRRLAAAIALIVSMAAGDALAYHEIGSFAATANAGGGGGVYATGSPRFKGYTCALCHTGGPGQIAVEVTSEPAELLASGRFSPGQVYRLDVRLIGEHRGLDSAFNPNTFTAEFVDAAGAPAGVLGVGDDPVVELTDSGHIAIAEGFGNGEDAWSFFWSPPAGDGPFDLYLALLDGDGASDPEIRFIDPFNDDVATFSRSVCRAGATCAAPEPEPEVESPAAGCSAASRPGYNGWALVLLLGLVAAARRRRRALAVVATLGAIALIGCAKHDIGLLDPHPSVSRRAVAGLELVLGPNVADAFTVSFGDEKVRVSRWRATLGRGIEHVAPASSNPRLVAQILEVELTLEPLATAGEPTGPMLAHGGGHGLGATRAPPRGGRARIRYSAVITRPGQVKPVARASGTITVSQTSGRLGELVQGAVEAMFERLVADVSRLSGRRR